MKNPTNTTKKAEIVLGEHELIWSYSDERVHWKCLTCPKKFVGEGANIKEVGKLTNTIQGETDILVSHTDGTKQHAYGEPCIACESIHADNPYVKKLIAQAEARGGIQQLEWILKHGHGGGNFRRLAILGIAHLEQLSTEKEQHDR